MKKILTFLLVATMLCAMFVMPSAAADDVNFADTVDFIETAPKPDGIVNVGEYGDVLPHHTYSENPEQFAKDAANHDQYGNWDVEFYSAWDAENIYFAWVVKSEIHHGLVKGTYDGSGNLISEEWPTDPEEYAKNLGHMWWNSCVQFIITPGAPGTGDYTNNYLEVGLCLLSDGDIGKVAWQLPKGVKDIDFNDWDAAIVRDDANNTTTYEVSIPKAMSGIGTYGTDAQFGLTYAAAAQENYLTDTPGMLEWQNGILGSKEPNNAAVMTLAGGNEEQEDIIDIKEGELPEEAKDAVTVIVDDVNTAMTGEDAKIITDLTMDYNGIYAYNMLLAPVEGEAEVYELVATTQGEGVAPEFDVEVTEGMVILCVHSDGSEGAQGLDRFNTAYTIGIGSKVKIFGVNVAEGELAYTNPCVYVTELVEVDNGEEPVESSEVIEESSEVVSSEAPAVSSEAASSEAPAESSAPAASNSTSSAASSVADAAQEGGIGTGAIIGIVAAVIAVIAVVVVVIKKKK